MATQLTIRSNGENEKSRIYISDGTAEVGFTQFKKGVYFKGNQKAIDAVTGNKETLRTLGLTDSALNVMLAVSENQENLDAINTWDHSYMSFGMFQWTVGIGADPGELAALLHKIKTTTPGIFNAYFGQYGLDIEPVNPNTGYFILDNKKLHIPSDKEVLRSLEWAFHFWKSGQVPLVQSVQIQHAFSRIDTFYRSNSYKINDRYLADLISSEYGVSLLLDNHVNRPGYLKSCIEAALKQANLGDPAGWDTKEEMILIREYLKIRAVYGQIPMTDADKRAAVTKKYLDIGTISAERGSFQL